MLIDEQCTEACEAQVTCTVCKRTKLPRGRSAPLEMYGCDWDCPGYVQEPHAGHLWPGELKRYRDEQKENRDA